MNDEAQVRRRPVVDGRTLGSCLALIASMFGVAWMAPSIPFAVVAIRYVDFETAQTIQRLAWVQAGLVLLCLAVAVWSARSVWKRMVGTAAVDSTGSAHRGIAVALTTIVLCLVAAIVLTSLVTWIQMSAIDYPAY